MEQNKETKWYPVEYSGFWQIQNCEEYDGIDMLDADDVGEEQARQNAMLAASAPQMKELIGRLHWWLSAMLKNYPQHEAHSAYKLLEDCVELEKQLQ